MRIILSFFLTAFLLACVSCSSSEFSLEATFNGLGTQNVRVTYASEAGVCDTFITATNDEFVFKGSSEPLTVVSLWNSQGGLLARVAAQNGDNISVEADVQTLPLVKVTGSDINERWTEFRDKNLVLYTNPDSRQRDKAITEWAQKHPDDVLSTILILWDMGDITNHKEVLKLINTLQPEARPQHLIDSFEAMVEQNLNQMKNIHSLRLCGMSGDFEVVTFNDKPMLLYFWRSDDPDRKTAIKQLKTLDPNLIADIYVDGDTASWRNTCRGDSAAWKHYWAPSGVMDPALKGLNISASPFFVVTNSTSAIIYQGKGIKEALDRIK